MKNIESKKVIMSMGEFKAWLEGFSECFKNGFPNKAQWGRVMERLSAVNVQQEIIYSGRPYWWPTWYSYSFGPLIGNSLQGTSAGNQHAQETIVTCNANTENMTYIAATEIGKTEALEFIS